VTGYQAQALRALAQGALSPAALPAAGAGAGSIAALYSLRLSMAREEGR
jgi:hypothetical protein